MIQYLITLAIFMLLAIFYYFYYRPKRQLQAYKDKFEALGYKVKLFPFQILGSPIFKEFLKQEKNHGDPLYKFKNQYHKYDILLYNTLSTPTIEFESQQLISNFFHPDHVYIHYKMPFLIQNIQRSLGLGIAFSEGKQWKRKRGIMNSVFNYEFITENIPKISRICSQNLDLIQKESIQHGKIQQKDGEKIYKVRIFEIFASIFSNVMLECFFGIGSTHQKINNQSVATFINSLNADITEQNFDLPLILFGAKFGQLGLRKKDRDINQRIKLLRQLASKFIKIRLAQLQNNKPREKYQDIIQALILKKSLDTTNKFKPNKSQASNYDFQQLIEQFCTFFTAGTDTTSHFTQMMIYYISQNKDIEQKLRKQINEVIKSDEDITKQNLKKLTYIDWIQYETTRYYGPGNGVFPRIAQKDHFIGQLQIKKGTALSVQPTTSHFNQKYFKNPFQFKPERWESQASAIHLMGFGGGPRTCIGKHLAMLQSKIAIVKFIRRYKQFKLPQEKFRLLGRFLVEPQPMEMTLIPDI